MHDKACLSNLPTLKTETLSEIVYKFNKMSKCHIDLELKVIMKLFKPYNEMYQTFYLFKNVFR